MTNGEQTTLNGLRSRKLFSVFLFLLTVGIVIPAKAQFETPVMGARGAAMGGCYVALSDDASAMQGIAALSRKEGGCVAIGYQQNYLLQGMGHKWLSAGYGITPTGSALVSYHHFGNATYNEQHFSVGYAQSLGAQVSVGATIDYLYSGTSDNYYDPMRGLTFTAALHLTLGNGWTLGARVFNPATIQIGSDDNSRIPAKMNVGAAWQVTQNWTTTAEVEKNIYTPFSLRAGVEYTFFKYFRARAGIATGPTIFTFGLGVLAKHYALDMAATIHPTLGLTPLVGGAASF